MLSAFHFINRIADLLDVDPEALPESLRRFESVRRVGVWIASRMMKRMDLAIRPYLPGYAEAREAIREVAERELGQTLGDELDAFSARPALIESLQLALEERATRSSLGREVLVRVHEVVEDALPGCAEDASGFHPRPADPVDAFAFVGTRYAYRTSKSMVDDLRAAGYDDLGILDLAIAVADANQWARMWRLTGAPAELFRLHSSVRAASPAHAQAGA